MDAPQANECLSGRLGCGRAMSYHHRHYAGGLQPLPQHATVPDLPDLEESLERDAFPVAGESSIPLRKVASATFAVLARFLLDHA